MSILDSRSLVSMVVLPFALIAVPLAGPASAQSQGPVGEVRAGVFLFPDDGLATEPFVGGAARLFAGPRLSLGPEVIYIQGEHHSHVRLIGKVEYDFARPVAAETPHATPFVTGGIGLFHSRSTFEGTEYTSTASTFTAGGGMKVVVGKNVYFLIESDVGWPVLQVQISAAVGVRLGK